MISSVIKLITRAFNRFERPLFFAMKTDIIGQTGIINKIQDLALAQNKTGYSPHMIFIARKGMGKTHLARYYSNLLTDKTGKRREIIELNCAALSGVDFINDFCIPQVHDQHVTVIFDEAGEIPAKATMLLLSICEKNSAKVTKIQGVDGEVYEFDFRKFTFIFCTNEPQKVNEALMSRLLRIELEDYKDAELTDIFSIKFSEACKNLELAPNTAKIISKYMRNSPREALNLCDLISSYCYARDIEKVDNKVWNQICKEYKIYPLGLNSTEVKILMLLYKRGTMQLQEIAACLRTNKLIVQKEYETFLRDLEFIHIVGKRKITGKGINYLKALIK